MKHTQNRMPMCDCPGCVKVLRIAYKEQVTELTFVDSEEAE